MRRQWAGYEEPKWQRMRRPSAATAITNQADATRSQQHQHNCFLDIEPSQMVFKVMQGMSSDRPRAVRYTENIRKRQAWKHLFTRSSVQSYQDWNIAENENLQQLPSPRLLALASRQKNIYKNQAARPLKNRAAGTAVHSLPSSAEAWHVHSHPKTISRLRRSVRRINENRRDAHAYANPRNR